MPKSSGKTAHTRSTRSFPASMACPPAVPRMGMATRSSSSVAAVSHRGMTTRLSSSTTSIPTTVMHQASTPHSPPSTPPPLNPLPSNQGESILPHRIIYTYSRRSPRKPSPQRTASVLSTESDFSLPTMEEFFEWAFPQLAPSPSSSVARHMEEIDSRLAKFTRNPRKEVTSLRDALHKIINNFAEESKKANNLLEKVIGIFEREAVCCICTDFMQEPVTLSACGHSFCGSCIHRHFCERLATYGISVPPKDRIQLQAAIQVIEARGELPREIFVYSCPHCRTKVREPPVADFQLKAILSDAKVLLHDQFKSRDILGAPSAGLSNSFEGLFLRDHPVG